MYMFLPFLTAFIGLVLVWFEKRLAGLLMLAITVGILMLMFELIMTSLVRMSLRLTGTKFEHQNAQSQGKGQCIRHNQGPLFNDEAIDKP